MRFFRSMLSTALILTCVAAVVPATAWAAEGAGPEATIKAGTAAWIKAYNERNADAIVALYAEDAVVMPPGAPVARGQAALRQYLAKELAGARDAGNMLALAEDEVGVSGDLGWHTGLYKVINSKTGVIVNSGSYMEIWRKKGGEWRIARDIWNSDRPATPPAAKPK